MPKQLLIITNCTDSMDIPWENRVRAVIGLLICAIFIAGILFTHNASAQISLSPLRAVITPQDPEFRFIISNPSQRLTTAKISLLDLKATQTGYENPSHDHRTQFSAAPWLIITPTRVTLKPGTREEITVRLRKSITSPVTEKRSHLLVQIGAARENIHLIDTKGIGLDMELAMSVPVILRPIKIETNKFSKQTTEFIKTELVRNEESHIVMHTNLSHDQLKRSLFGDVIVSHQSHKREANRIYYKAGNIALFTDHPERQLILPLGRDNIPKGILSVKFIGRGEYEGQLLAEKLFSIK